jgi:hypothetical protein
MLEGLIPFSSISIRPLVNDFLYSFPTLGGIVSSNLLVNVDLNASMDTRALGIMRIKANRNIG